VFDIQEIKKINC